MQANSRRHEQRYRRRIMNVFLLFLTKHLTGEGVTIAAFSRQPQGDWQSRLQPSVTIPTSLINTDLRGQVCSILKPGRRHKTKCS